MRTTTKSFRRNLLLAPLLLALAAVAAPAMADDDDDRRGWRYHHDDDDDRRRWDRHDRRGYYADRRHDRRYERYDRRHDRRYDRRWDRDWDARDRRYHPVSGRWDNGRRGPPPWARGRDYRGYGYGNVYYVPVEYYPRYRLYRPPHGYRWVRDDYDNFLLVAVTTGIISQILNR